MKTKFIQLVVVLFFFFGAFSCKEAINEVKEIEATPVQVTLSSSKDLVSAAKKEIKQISPDQLEAKMQSGEYYIIDVREKEEYVKGNIPGSILIPRGFLEFKIGKEEFWEDKTLKMPTHDQKIILYCKSGGRGSLSTKSLQEMGYTNIVNLDGGYLNWVSTYPSEAPEEN